MRRLLVPLLMMLSVFALLAMTSSPGAAIDLKGGVGGGPLGGILTVTVVDQRTGAPIAGAFCQVGPEPGTPFLGNLAFTNASGIAVLSHTSLVGPQTVTVGKAGYSYFTVFGVDASQMILPIRLKGAEAPKALYSGDISASGFTLIPNDGKFDVAVVMPSLSIDDLTTLGDFEQFAPIVLESFPLVGEQPVPGLIYMPLQVEFLLIPVERTPYYVWLEDHTTQDLYTFYGRVPTATLLDIVGADKPEFLPLIQNFTLRKVGIEPGIPVNGPDSQLLQLTNTVSFNLRVNVSNTLAGYDVFAFVAADLDGETGLGRIVPCGFGGGVGGSSASLLLSTITAGGDFTGMDYLAGAIESDATLGLANSFVVDRSSLAPGETSNISTFFRPPVLSTSGAQLSWTTVENPGVSPAPDLYNLELALVKTIPDTNLGAQPGDTLDVPTPLWDFVVNGTGTALTVPTLHPSLAPGVPDPAVTADQDRLDWTAYGVRIGLPPAFDYDAWDFADRARKGTQLAWNTRKFAPFPSGLYTGVPESRATRPFLGPARPNPFQHRTTVTLAAAGAQGPVRVEVYDMLGRRVRTIDVPNASGARPAEIAWDGRDGSGLPLPAGAYFLRVEGMGRGEAIRVVKLSTR